MPINFFNEIPRMLRGETSALERTPKEHLDWAGVSAVLELFGQTSGREREDIIQAMGQILEAATQPAPILAEIVHIASSLDLSQIEPSVKKLQVSSVASHGVVRDAITNYLAFRQVRSTT